MKQQIGYTADEFFGMIADAVDVLDVSSTASLLSFYHSLDKVLRIAVTQRVGDFDIAFAAGLFAKTDFLAKQLELDKNLRRRVNEARSRMRHLLEETENLKMAWPHDMRAVAEFISAMYDHAVIPAKLTMLFPSTALPQTRQRLLATKIRVVATRVEGNRIMATLESTGEDIVVMCRQSQAYLTSIVSKGDQLNLVLPRKTENGIEAEHIILHPDLLVNITTVAACFEDYATDARLYMLNKIKPQENTVHTILGNFAGMMLDDAVHKRDTGYNAAIMRYCRDNALEMASCADSLRADFHLNAQKQLGHIKNVVEKVMPQEVKGFDPKEVMLEPSFICEMLGLQGRMDLLQLDFRVLVEQKAGKGVYGYGERPGEQPKQKTKHYVQLLMYMAVLHYSYNIPSAEIYSFLLYSRYEKSLLQLGSAPELLNEAIKIRNLVAWTEYYLADKGFGVYERMTASSIAVNEAQRKFFERFVSPRIDSLLEPLRNASELEKAYFRCFMKFVQRESILSRTGTKERDDEGFAQVWLLNAEEKAETGNIYYRLTIDEEAFETDRTGAVLTVTLRFPQDDTKGESAYKSDTSNFRKGDMVLLYPYPRKASPDARKSMVFKATIIDIMTYGLRLGLSSPQTDTHVFLKNRHWLWAVEHAQGDSASGAVFTGIYSLLSATADRSSLVLSQRNPRVDKSIRLIGDYGQFNQLVERAMQSRDLFLVIGPPGTGKTSFAMLNILKEELRHDSSSVLLLSYTNRAVDEMCSKLVESGIDFLRVGNRHACEEAYLPYMVDEKISGCNKLSDIVDILKGTRVVCATVSTLNSHAELLRMRHFSLAIVDEASQILEPHIVGILSARHSDGESSIGRFVLIGDHKQLPAVVLQAEADTRVTDPLLASADVTDCRHSFFQRMLRRYASNVETTYMLTRQGRMHRDIASFPSAAFYSGKLQPVPLPHQESELPGTTEGDCSPYETLLLTRRVAFIDVPDPPQSPSDKVNTLEADIIARIAVAAYRLREGRFSVQQSLGIIVPYRNQIATVRKAIDRYGIQKLHDITIDTVERYQGSQRDVVIYGFTIRHRYQLNFLTSNDFEEDGVVIDPKLNVAMTRARENLVLVGNKNLLSLDPVFRRMIDSLKNSLTP